MQIRSMLCATMLTLVAQAAIAITPEQAGTYEGTFVGKRFTLDGASVPHKDDLKINIFGDTSAVVFVGSAITISNAKIGVTNGYLELNIGGDHLNIFIHFRKAGVIKGEITYNTDSGLYLPNGSYLQGKFTLKKKTPTP